ncbi:hypothetical protein EJ04DRAFT_48528 [Polyplosphaeria fusca]|uniref:tRNA-splicing endonuclease subunit Sen2 n=1 Tax=Polyplosphaeria fusca TaxID=682080 RepID=A0A9P4QRB1_9PLEO|nr:hypothetical protein EJ04DRAFT_48528 [Polyplosphaeria fusca]
MSLDTAPVVQPAETSAPNLLPSNTRLSTPANCLNSRPTDGKSLRPKKPSPAQRYIKPLPLEVHPLPAFIPHNPLSYLRIAAALLSHSIWPPSSSNMIHKGYFSPETQSIHVTDESSIKALWEQGFWGSGSLSRSEPQWLQDQERKRGLGTSTTAWEITQGRREQRRQLKLERAQKQQETIQKQRQEENKINVVESMGETPLDETSEATISPVPFSANTLKVQGDKEEEDEMLDEKVINQEHLQLTLEEAFFLTFAIGTLHIYRSSHLLPVGYLFRLYAIYSDFPIPEGRDTILFDIYQHQRGCDDSSDISTSLDPVAPDSPFLLKYAVFHHFRSLGWVVRDGIKFACDYLLYKGGPAFSHAQFAVMILPAYSHPYWSETPERKAKCGKKESKDWWWLHQINRVETSAFKTLVLVYVEVPPPWDDTHPGKALQLNVGEILKQYKVREFVVNRWSVNRHRD